MLLVPTRVGMIPNGYIFRDSAAPCPHTRGDDPNRYWVDTRNTALSPHAWG